ncbi:MAG: cysteine--tRNA ligase, partial [Gammaproteobacteria bacterium]|nr:cysteine--tRNA ligase [Gammaproteobacteria bacterium]
MQIYNTLSKTKEPLSQLNANALKMYVCGVTVYDRCHIGHARVYTVFDSFVRYLRSRGVEVTYVRNITDIDDKIIAIANERGIAWNALTESTIALMHQDFAKLGILPPDIEPRATESVPEIIEIVTKLIDRGLAYAADNGDVYYSVAKFEGYGKLSGRKLEDMRAGERVEVNPHKTDPMDFVLWKASKPNEPSWESPWGPGRPGWHIECSAMVQKHLGLQIDLHGGGEDLPFPHHENE